MQENTFSEKLYTSTEVAQILGVSLRSIYRYLDENKIQAAVKTATGRHRFTKQNINDFLHPSGNDITKEVQKTQYHTEIKKPVIEDSFIREDKILEDKVGEVTKEQPVAPSVEKEAVKDEPVDWLARFRQAAEKYKTQVPVEEPAPVTKDIFTEKTTEVELEPEEESNYYYYRSGIGGLKEIAQSIDKSAKNASIDYAFTMNAGLSLHKPIKPFSLIHSYVRTRDLSYFEKVLQLTPCQKDTAQLCLITSNDDKLYSQRTELHGLYVVSDAQIRLDLMNEGETELANELA